MLSRIGCKFLLGKVFEKTIKITKLCCSFFSESATKWKKKFYLNFIRHANEDISRNQKYCVHCLTFVAGEKNENHEGTQNCNGKRNIHTGPFLGLSKAIIAFVKIQ